MLSRSTFWNGSSGQANDGVSSAPSVDEWTHVCLTTAASLLRRPSGPRDLRRLRSLVPCGSRIPRRCRVFPRRRRRSAVRKSSAMEFLETLLGGPLTLGGAISAIREGEGESLSQFAKRLGISRRISATSSMEGAPSQPRESSPLRGGARLRSGPLRASRASGPDA